MRSARIAGSILKGGLVTRSGASSWDSPRAGPIVVATAAAPRPLMNARRSDMAPSLNAGAPNVLRLKLGRQWTLSARPPYRHFQIHDRYEDFLPARQQLGG